MPIMYTNRKGVVYYLQKGTTKKGKPRYSLSKEPSERCIEDVPEGYEITESVNGVVSLRKITPRLISELEVQAVKAAVQSCPHLQRYRVDVKKNAVVIYEPLGSSAETLKQIFGNMVSDSMLDRIRLEEERYTQYSPVMRFLLVDEEKRVFEVERMCYRSSLEGWLSLHRWGKIQSLAKQHVRHLGKESFYELY